MPALTTISLLPLISIMKYLSKKNKQTFQNLLNVDISKNKKLHQHLPNVLAITINGYHRYNLRFVDCVNCSGYTVNKFDVEMVLKIHTD